MSQVPEFKPAGDLFGLKVFVHEHVKDGEGKAFHDVLLISAKDWALVLEGKDVNVQRINAALLKAVSL